MNRSPEVSGAFTGIDLERLMGFLEGKKALVIGVASHRSIAYGIARAMHREGAELAFTFQNRKMGERIEKYVAEFDSDIMIPCNVENDEEIEAVFEHLDNYWDHLDILIHSVAYAPRELLEGDFLDNVTREGFRIAHDISSYSLAAFAKAARQMMQGRNAAILTLSYLGAERAMPSYNVMGLAKASLEANVRYLAYTLGSEGIRVNAVSAGPIRTLAASGIGDFRKLQSDVAKLSPLHRNVTIEEVGNVGAFLCSDLASGITSEIVYVDGGFHNVAPTCDPV